MGRCGKDRSREFPPHRRRCVRNVFRCWNRRRRCCEDRGIDRFRYVRRETFLLNPPSGVGINKKSRYRRIRLLISLRDPLPTKPSNLRNSARMFSSVVSERRVFKTSRTSDSPASSRDSESSVNCLRVNRVFGVWSSTFTAGGLVVLSIIKVQ